MLCMGISECSFIYFNANYSHYKKNLLSFFDKFPKTYQVFRNGNYLQEWHSCHQQTVHWLMISHIYAIWSGILELEH